MRQQEAEQEAARRNAEDERRHRFLFYALDHSAGMGDDAWEVEIRLRTAEEGALPAPVTVAATAPVERVEETQPATDALPATEAFDALRAVEPAEPLDEEVAPAVRATELDAAPPPRTRRRLRPRLIQVWGAFVILVGLLFVGATLLLSVVLHNYTHFGVIPTAVGIGLGFMAIWLGVALARTG